MAGRGQTTKLYRTFVKGLVSEAGYLTYPENASTDELNTVIKRKGSRSRRLGIDYEPDSTDSILENSAQNSIISEFYWKAVGNDASLNFLVLQVGSDIRFYDTSSAPLSDGLKSFSFSLLDYMTTTATEAQVESSYVQMANGKGFLFVVQEFTTPFLVNYLSDTDDIEIIPIIIQVRDFDGINDNLANDEEPTTLSKEHFYNLRNQGWVGVGTGPIGPGGSTPVPPPPASGDGGFYNPWLGVPQDVTP